ncbi:MAG: phosphodiester glycosidase family protein [Agathobacter sp.]|nr:phosphodiester glycosidase family protein [Agathobacter sp.]
MKSEVKVLTRENGELQRVQSVHLDDWSQLDFFTLKQETVEQQIQALHCFADIYENYLVPACPWIFSKMVMFCLPEDVDVPPYESERYGKVTDPLTIATILLQDGVKLKGKTPVFKMASAERLYKELEVRNCVRIVYGKSPKTQMIPVGRFAGYMSEVLPEAKMKVNANFFIMDPFDCATVYDQVGTPFGLCVKDGVVEYPPLFNREALLVEKDGVAYISKKDIRELMIEINDRTYLPGKNTTIYTRPEKAKTPDEKGRLVVIIGRRVVAVKDGGSIEIPASGFVMKVGKGANISPGDMVTYHGLKDVQFGIQVGNSIIKKGVKTDRFISRFYNIYKLQRVPFPPCLYPMNFEKARAARIGLGADKECKPVIFWAEGAGKIGYVSGKDSTGASLLEMADIAVELGLRNAINLDGGGSAQILIDNVRTLRISDRNKEDNNDAERLVPLGLIVK